VKLSTTNLTKCSIFVANPISPHKWAFLGGTFSRKKITTIRKKNSSLTEGYKKGPQWSEHLKKVHFEI